MLKSPENRSLPSLEGLRLIASCAIVANHYLEYLHKSHDGLPIAVDLFFVISGIVITMVYQNRIRGRTDYYDFMLKRIARLYPLHLATLLFYILIGLLAVYGLVTPENAEKYNSRMIVPNLLLVHAWSPYSVISYNYVSWSISAEFFVYLCFPIILAILCRGFALGFAICIALLFASILFSEVTLGVHLTKLGWNMGALRALPSFSLGVCFWTYRDRLADWRGLGSAARLIFSIAFALTVALIFLYPTEYLLLVCVYVVVLSAFVCDLHGAPTLASWYPISSRGRLTYSIYMLHTVIGTVIISFLFPRLFGESYTSTIAAVVCAVVLTLVISGLSYSYFETPVRAGIVKAFVQKRPIT